MQATSPKASASNGFPRIATSPGRTSPIIQPNQLLSSAKNTFPRTSRPPRQLLESFSQASGGIPEARPAYHSLLYCLQTKRRAPRQVVSRSLELGVIVVSSPPTCTALGSKKTSISCLVARMILTIF